MKKIFKKIISIFNRHSFFKGTRDLKDIEKGALTYIGFIALETCNHNYKDTYKFLDKIGITDVLYKNNKLHIKMKRPGLFIGQHGEFINKCNYELRSIYRNDKLEIIVHEYDLDTFLIPIDYSDYDY